MKHFFVILCMLAISGCSVLPDFDTEPKTTINTVQEFAQCTELSVLPPPAKMSFDAFEWEIWNKQLTLVKGKEMDSGDAVWVMRGRDYEALAKNMAEIKRYVQSLTEIIRNYEAQAERIVESNKSKLNQSSGKTAEQE